MRHFCRCRMGLPKVLLHCREQALESPATPGRSVAGSPSKNRHRSACGPRLAPERNRGADQASVNSARLLHFNSVARACDSTFLTARMEVRRTPGRPSKGVSPWVGSDPKARKVSYTATRASGGSVRQGRDPVLSASRRPPGGLGTLAVAHLGPLARGPHRVATSGLRSRCASRSDRANPSPSLRC